MFDNDISTFKNLSSAPVTISLNRWINSTMNPTGKFAKQVRRYRESLNRLIDTGLNIEDAKKELEKYNLKKGLPLATIGAVCEGGRKRSNVVTRTGWIALDIDAKDNPHIEDVVYLRDQIAHISFVAFAGLSVSGKGVWALVKMKEPRHQEQYFKQLKVDFNHFGITLDSTKGKNPNDGRFYSLDPDAYIADEFKIYDRLTKKKPIKKPDRPSRELKYSSNGNDTQSRVEALISKIQARRIDITAGYDNWRNLGFALEDEFGEAGRKYLHAIGQYHPEYDSQKTDREYTNWLKHKHTGEIVGIGTFFHKCQEFGLTLDQHHATRRDNGLEPKYGDDDPAPYGFNPFTGEVFDERGYPSEWDTVALEEVSTIMQPQLN